MKIKINDRVKSVVLLFLLLTCAVVWGTSSAMLFIEDSYYWAIVSLISYFLVFAVVFAIDMHTNQYKFKYLFARKKFKEKLKIYESELLKYSKKERKRIIAGMQKEFRRTGDVAITMYYELETPSKVWRDNNVSFNYGNALDEQKIQYLIFCLNSNCLTAGGLYRFFEDLTFDKFSYDEYVSLVKNCKYFSEDLKKLLTKKEFKKIFEIFKKQENLSEANLTEEDMAMLRDFDENDSNLLFDYHEELHSIVEDLAIKEYLFIKKKDSLPQGVKKMFVSKDGMKRVIIRFDESLKLYKICKQDFVFYCDEYSVFNSGGGWVTTEENSFFETEKLAIKEIKGLVEDFEEVKFD